MTLHPDGSVTYDPSASSLLQLLAAGDTVVDTFDYTVSDGTGASETAVVAVTVAGKNDNPVANNDLAVVGYQLQAVDYPGATSTTIVGLNNLGIALGTYADASGGHIFTFDGTTFSQIDDDIQLLLDAQGITSSISPQGINDAGVIVGGIAGTSNVVGFTGARGFIYDRTNLLPVRYGVRDSGLADLNNSGLAVGTYASPAGYTTTAFGFTYDNGQVGSVAHPDHTYLRGTWLTDATDAGVLLGNYYPDFYTSARGFVFDGQTWTDVLVPGTTWGYASGINNVGTIVGTQIHQNGADRYGFVFDGANYESFQYPGWTGWTDLQDINDAGVLAGGAAGHGFIARPATSADKDTVFLGRTLSTLSNDTEIDVHDSLATLPETISSTLGATVRILADGRFEYDPGSSTQLQGLFEAESLTDTFTYTLVDSHGGSDTATVSITVFGSGVAGTPPVAMLVDGAVTAGGGDHAFGVRYEDDDAVDVASIDSGDIRVTGPHGFDVAATLVGVDDPNNQTPITATYSISAPGGSWDGADNGTYTILLQAGEVLDVDGHAADAVQLGTLSVEIDAAPTLVVTGTTSASVGEPVVLTLNAVGSFPSDPNDSFTFDLDWENDGIYEERISGQTDSQASHTYAARGLYVIGVRAIDRHAQAATTTHSVHITDYRRVDLSRVFVFARTEGVDVRRNQTFSAGYAVEYSPVVPPHDKSLSKDLAERFSQSRNLSVEASFPLGSTSPTENDPGSRWFLSGAVLDRPLVQVSLRDLALEEMFARLQLDVYFQVPPRRFADRQ